MMSVIKTNRDDFQNEVMNSSKPLFLDVRTPEEYAAGTSKAVKMFPCKA